MKFNIFSSINYNYCAVPEISIPTPRKVIGNSEGEGISKAKCLQESMKLNWKFLGIWIFAGATHLKIFQCHNQTTYLLALRYRITSEFNTLRNKEETQYLTHDILLYLKLHELKKKQSLHYMSSVIIIQNIDSLFTSFASKSEVSVTNPVIPRIPP